ncbi:ARL14 effector protein isoform X2 [Ornithorhynchus anatinus]|uniref:ARL14 effector protein isoform X2 n=1 Tax=Ornithorhynchus anatinus TaxID=9258 RepID=UPI0010A7F99A|nr:ARL14 effector protein isoform X2 [Ornithorhynchus anatinus]
MAPAAGGGGCWPSRVWGRQGSLRGGGREDGPGRSGAERLMAAAGSAAAVAVAAAAARDPVSGGAAGPGRRRAYTKGRTAKALKSLQFANPGRQTEFTPETSKREKRRLQSKNTPANSDRQVIPAKSKVYDSQGLLIYSGMDLCDCLDEDCLGCFYACPNCGSNKCGPECRCDRKWLYEQIEIEGGEVIRNKHVG